MKIILLNNILNLGNFGDIINVNNGYARNFLIPKKKACLATKKKILKFKLLKSKFIFFFKKKIKKDKKIFKKINNLNIFFYKKSNIHNIIFNQINKFDIIKKLEKKKIFIKNNQIKFNKNFFKKIGKYKIKILLNYYKNITLCINILKKNINYE